MQRTAPTNLGPPTAGLFMPKGTHVKKINAFGTSAAALAAVSYGPTALLLVALLIAGIACLLRWYANLSPAQLSCLRAHRARLAPALTKHRTR